MGFRDDFKEIKCSDGTTKLIVKRVEKIPALFGQWVPEWSFKLNTAIKAAQDAIISPNADVEIAKEAKVILDTLTDLDNAARTKFYAAYMHFMSDPCTNNAEFGRRIDEINKSIDKMAEIEQEAKKLQQQQVLTKTLYKTADKKVDSTVFSPTMISEHIISVANDVIKSIEKLPGPLL